MSELIVELFEPVQVVSEMATGSGVLVPVPRDTLEAIREEDNDPKFATVVIESGWSKSKRLWDTDVFESVHEQMSNPGSEPIVGYLGHIAPDDDPYSFPDIQFQWLASKLNTFGQKARLFTKAYVLPDTKARYYMKKGLARTFSWRGKCNYVPIQGGKKVKDYVMESIDLARPRSAGMQAVMVGGLTSEMDEGRNHEVKTEEISNLSEHELRAYAPNLVKAIEEAARKPLDEKVSEMTDAAKEAETKVNVLDEIRKLFGMDENADTLDVLKNNLEAMKKAGATVRDRIVDEVLEKKFKDENTRKLVRRVVVSEMKGKELKLYGDEAHEKEDHKAVSEMVNGIIDSDEDMKSMVSEMEGGEASTSGAGTTDRNSQREIKAGYESSTIRVRAATR